MIQTYGTPLLLPSQNHSNMANKLRAVVIDDDDDDLGFIMETLQNTFAFDINGFTNSVEAIEYILTHAVDIDVVITDLKMPMLSGFEVMERMKGNPASASLDVIVLSTSNNPDDVTKAKELGAAQFISKPHSYSGYIEIIQAIMKLVQKAKA